MREQLIATVERGSSPHRELDTVGVPALASRLGQREAQHLRAVTAVDNLGALLVTAENGRLESSLLDLALAILCDVETARRAVASLDPVDHVVSVDIQRVPAEEPWCLTWAPVTSIVDLMLDWDLPVLDITLIELSEWLGVPPDVTDRAVRWLTHTPGVTVASHGNDHEATVHIAIDLDRCPLTGEVHSAAG